MMKTQKCNSKSIAQGTIEPLKAASIAQGTIEYLVIIAIVVVISLVVVALLLGIFESNSDVGTTAQNISTQTLPVALNEAVLGVGDDANGLIILTNNTGSIIRDVRVLIDGKDHNYFGINVAQGNKVTFKLNSLQIPCPSGQDKVIKNITILYTTKNGLEQKQILENITLQCTQNPTSTTTPVQENQQEETETPEEPEPTPSDIINPELTNLSSEVDGTTIHLTFRAWDNNEIQKFEIKENDEDYEIITPEYVEDYLDGNYYTIINDELEYETQYTFCIKVTDYNNKYTEECDTNTTEPEPDLCPEETELYGECYSDVILYYPLNENANDFSLSENNGVLKNGVTFNNLGKLGNSATFDGTNDYIESSSNINLTGASSKTLMYWVKANNLNDYLRLISFGIVDNSKLFGNYAAITEGNLYFWGAWNDWDTGIKIIPDVWQHISITYDGTTVKTYLNGILINSNNVTLNTGAGKLEIGYQPLENDGRYFDGSIDEVIIFNTALSGEDINKLYYNSGGTTIEQLRTGLIGYWPLNNNVEDYSTSGSYDLTYVTTNYIDGVLENGVSTPGIGNINYYPTRHINDDSIFDVSSSASLTVCAWAKKTTAIGEEAIVAKNDQSGSYTGWRFILLSNNECGPITNAAGLDLIDGSNRRLVRSTISFPQGEWQYVCGIINRNTQQAFIYQEGQDVTYTGGTGYCSRSLSGLGQLNASTGLGIGLRDPSKTWNCFNGEIDEVAIWNRALSSSEIQALYNEGEGLNLIQ